ncbi:unnamed protein product [Vitrella brassicaformis CCMP3155]|uniref:Apple domain-containing protein n=1 Tax=Vitrella brassicaformis (strain CCMP3155) TaxID=1169540 RepID=A0A0G4FS27_VITBC|nr:unnamed protein product [Vitrella brassicaformis CCMP3155]|eukprot:CEM16912.1 unnamed protein product [Vitrella brassicaformis CCMP3155]
MASLLPSLLLCALALSRCCLASATSATKPGSSPVAALSGLPSHSAVRKYNHMFDGVECASHRASDGDDRHIANVTVESCAQACASLSDCLCFDLTVAAEQPPTCQLGAPGEKRIVRLSKASDAGATTNFFSVAADGNDASSGGNGDGAFVGVMAMVRDSADQGFLETDDDKRVLRPNATPATTTAASTSLSAARVSPLLYFDAYRVQNSWLKKLTITSSYCASHAHKHSTETLAECASACIDQEGCECFDFHKDGSMGEPSCRLGAKNSNAVKSPSVRGYRAYIRVGTAEAAKREQAEREERATIMAAARPAPAPLVRMEAGLQGSYEEGRSGVCVVKGATREHVGTMSLHTCALKCVEQLACRCVDFTAEDEIGQEDGGFVKGQCALSMAGSPDDWQPGMIAPANGTIAFMRKVTEQAPPIGDDAPGAFDEPLSAMSIAEESECRACNGVGGLCDLPVLDVTYPGTHNSESYDLSGCECLAFTCGCESFHESQNRSLITQLDDGIRALDLDFCSFGTTEAVSCHESGRSTRTAAHTFASIAEWLDAHPCDLLLIRLSNVERASDTDLVATALMASPLANIIYPSAIDRSTTVREVLGSGRHAVVIWTEDSGFDETLASRNDLPFSNHGEIWTYSEEGDGGGVFVMPTVQERRDRQRAQVATALDGRTEEDVFLNVAHFGQFSFLGVSYVAQLLNDYDHMMHMALNASTPATGRPWNGVFVDRYEVKDKAVLRFANRMNEARVLGIDKCVYAFAHDKDAGEIFCVGDYPDLSRAWRHEIGSLYLLPGRSVVGTSSNGETHSHRADDGGRGVWVSGLHGQSWKSMTVL